ncbi:MAG TPA: DUF1328 domain-containing protein [Burkholderiales bacterium]|nr:DUF1328 domain-containing protein [Burkholderiales bacterium]
MFYYAIAFFSIAMASGLYGFSGVTEGAALIGTVLGSVFLIMSVACLLIERTFHAKSKLKTVNK